MYQSPIYNDLIITSTQISVHIKELIALIDEYLNKFERKEFFVFADDKKRDSVYRSEYYAFISKIPEISEDIGILTSKLSLLLVEADNEMDIALIVLIGKKNEACLALSKELSEFVSESKDIISKEGISPSTIVIRTRKLKIEIESILNCLEADQ